MQIELRNIPISSIEVGERFRKDYGTEDFTSFKNDIKEKGLIQPIAVMEKETPGLYTLAAGGRRIRACTELSYETIPCRVYPFSSLLDLRAIELAENFHRKQLSWNESVLLTKEIHKLQQEKHGERISPLTKEGWGQRETADLLGCAVGSINNDIKLATAYQQLPEVFKDCKTKADASKVLKNLELSIVNSVATKKFNESVNKGDADSVVSALYASYVVGDCLVEMPKLKDRSFDIAEVDPPYNLDLKFAIEMTGKQAAELMDPSLHTPEAYISFMYKVLQEVYRLLKQDAYLILWHPDDYALDKTKMPVAQVLFNILTDIGFHVIGRSAKWVKINSTGVSRAPHVILGNNYESFFYASKGIVGLAKQGRANTFLYQPLVGSRKVHPTERPIELIQEVLSTFRGPGASVLVPFLGSGNTILSAYNNKQSAVGFDISSEYKASFLRKIKDGIPGPFVSVR